MTLRLDRYLLIDGDILVYRAGFAVENTIYNIVNNLSGKLVRSFREKGDCEKYINLKGDENLIVNKEKEYPSSYEAINCIDSMINKIMGELAGYKPKIYLTGEGNFRDQIAVTKTYKGNRKQSTKPYYYNEIREHLINKHGATVTQFGMEADDYLAIHGTRLGKNNCIICSTDKDLKQIEGYHYDFVKGNLIYIDKTESYRNLFKQFIIGDSVDNIPGIPGGGNKLAKKLDEIDKISDMYAHVVKLYHDRKLNKNYLNEQGGLLYLLRSKNDSWISQSDKLEKEIQNVKEN